VTLVGGDKEERIEQNLKLLNDCVMNCVMNWSVIKESLRKLGNECEETRIIA